MPLKPKMIVIVDNLSTDSTLEATLCFDEVVKLSAKCSRGKGRDIAMDFAKAYAKPDDVLMHVDFDSIYTKTYVNYVKKAIKELQTYKGRYYIVGGLCLARLSPRWTDLNYAEDMERWARAKYKGLKIIMPPKGWEVEGRYFNNEDRGKAVFKREQIYAKGIKLYYRLFNVLVDTQRGIAFKSFKDFYATSKHKTKKMQVAYLLAYFVANLKGTYSYSKVDNRKYVFG
jgi:hypothetical protein